MATASGNKPSGLSEAGSFCLGLWMIDLCLWFSGCLFRVYCCKSLVSFFVSIFAAYTMRLRLIQAGLIHLSAFAIFEEYRIRLSIAEINFALLSAFNLSVWATLFNFISYG